MNSVWQQHRSVENSKSPEVSGLTFVEVIIAVAIMLLTMAPILQLFGTSHRGTGMTVNRAIAYNLANDIGEFVRAAPYRLIEESYLNHDFARRAGVPPLPENFRREVKVTRYRHDQSFLSDAENSPVAYRMVFEYKSVETRVKWHESGEEKDFVMSSIVVRK